MRGFTQTFGRIARGILMAAALAPAAASAQQTAIRSEQLPPVLKPWLPWVQDSLPELRCTPLGSEAQRLCDWPASLSLKLEADGASFTYRAERLSEGWLPLPGSDKHWPQQVLADGRPAAVIAQNGVPSVYLPAGSYVLSGRFFWQVAPQQLPAPAAIGLVRLEADTGALPLRRDSSGALWLKAEAAEPSGEPLKLQVFRKLEDGVPVTLTTHLLIEATGAAQTVLLDAPLPDGYTPLTLASGLPAQLEPDGRLRLQARAGTWTLQLTATAGRRPEVITNLKRPQQAAPWPEDEVWVWQAAADVRQVDISGAVAVDARQTQLPEDWKTLPAYQMRADSELLLAERQRGLAAAPPDNLRLQRQLWLDFAGTGYTVHDQLNGALHKAWRLDARNSLALGQVLVDGEPTLITQSAGGGSGVEIRREQLNVQVDGRLPPTSRLPVAGYAQEFNAAHTTLHLPPGYRLLAATGADQVSGDWLTAFSLLDVFLILMAVVASARLLGPLGALAAAACLALSWQDAVAVQWAWLHLLATTALLTALSPSLAQGKLGAFLRRWWFLALLAVVLPFFVYAKQQLQAAVHPVLEQPRYGSAVGVQAEIALDAAATEPATTEAAAAAPEEAAYAEPQVLSKAAGAPEQDLRYSSGLSLLKLPPTVLTQTGPGLPNWEWSRAELRWSGPIAAGQTWQAVLLPPWATRLWRVLAVVAGVAWMLLLLRCRLRMPPVVPTPSAPANSPPSEGGGIPATPSSADAAPTSATAGLLLTAVMVVLTAAFSPAVLAESPEPAAEPAPDSDSVAASADASEYLRAPNGVGIQPPSAEGGLLEELKNRLSRSPSCAPHCAEVLQLRLEAVGDSLTLRLSLAALGARALPLPVPRLSAADQAASWQPISVTKADGSPAALRRSEDGSLWLQSADGVTEVVLQGSLAGLSQLELPLPQKPRRVQSQLQGWQLSGVDDQGLASGSLLLQRQAPAEASADEPASATALPPLLRVTRSLSFGLEWEVETVVERVGSSHLPVLQWVPLLTGERPLDENLPQKDGTALVSLAPEQLQFAWRSRLVNSPSLTLIAARDARIFERWRFAIGSLWRPSFTGLAETARIGTEGLWQPEYQPWPGESLTLQLARPQGVKGQSLTLEVSKLTLSPGAQVRNLTLGFTLRASQGGPWSFSLPKGWQLETLTLDGNEQALRRQGQQVLVDLHPGSNQVNASLRQTMTMQAWLETPEVGVESGGVNAQLTIALPADRWLLALRGPLLGPALTFWGILLVWLAVAVALGSRLASPLKAWHWLLLALGLSQLPVVAAAVVVGWIALLGWRGQQANTAQWPRLHFNGLQLMLMALTLAALGALFAAVAQGLLGAPDMMLRGYGSDGNSLTWLQDRYRGSLPQAGVLSVSLWWYRGLMLMWALWLAFKLLDWLRWGWAQGNVGGLWRAAAPRPIPPPDTRQ